MNTEILSSAGNGGYSETEVAGVGTVRTNSFLDNLGATLGDAFGSVATTAIQTGQNLANTALQTANPGAPAPAPAQMSSQTKMILVGVGLLAVLFVVREFQKK